MIFHAFFFLYTQKLTRAKGSDSWSLGELCHALVILSHYHAISSFVFGVGIGDGEQEPPCIADASSAARRAPSSSVGSSGSSAASASALLDKSASDEADGPPSGAGSKGESRGGSGRSSPERRGASEPGSRRSTMGNGEGGESGLDALMRRMKSLAESRQEFSAEEQTKRYEHVESQSAELAVVPNEAAATRPKPEISQFIDDAEFVYQVNHLPLFVYFFSIPLRRSGTLSLNLARQCCQFFV